ncbi:SseB family protein [Streptococcus oralis]|uniref:SseB family protein n=1 Tax=Streptococcus oralis TaxID=1303 RepID=UPI0022835CBF|nr:SseB family protein [Streptococcus oralis]MCY7099166.1 SseB family protein [Streptococcus oralis]
MFHFFKKKTAKKEQTMSLSDYKKEYLREKTTESIEALFKELKRAKVWVPFNASLMDEGDGQEGARLKPDILRKGDDYFYPCFIEIQDIPKDYYDRFSWLQLPLTDCLFAAEEIGEFPVRGIVLDAFADSVEIDKGAFEAIRQS